MAQLRVTIVTPDGPVLTGAYDMLSCRSTTGELGIMPNHVPLVAPLDISAIRLKQGTETEKIAVTGGFLELSHNEATILATAAEKEEDIDLNRAKESKKRAEQRLQSKQDTLDIQRAEFALKRAINRIHVARH